MLDRVPFRSYTRGMPRNTPEAARVGATVKALREAYGWTLSKFSTQLQISHSYLSNIESGRRALPPHLARKVADVLGVPLAAITTEFDVEDVA